MKFPEVPLGAVTKIVNGGTPDTKLAAYWDGGVAWLTPKDMGKSRSLHIQETNRTISEAGLENCSARLVPPGSVILSTRAPIGHLAINDVEMAFNQGCRGLIPGTGLNAKFLYYFLQANIGLLNDLGTGTTFKELSAGALANVQMPLPPLPEQQRIVALLDEAFGAIDEAIATATREIRNTEDVFLSFRDGLLGGDDDWLEEPLGRSFRVKHGFAFESKYFDSFGKHVLLTPGNFYESGGFRDRGAAQKRYGGPVPPGFTLQPGALLVAMTEQAAGLLGSPLLVPEGEVYLHNQRLGLIEETRGPPLDRRFLYHLFNTAAFRRHMQDGATGTKVRHTSPSKIEAFLARFPPTVGAQSDLAERIDSMSTEVEALRAIYRRKLAALAELKQSLVARALSGELIREPLAA